VVARAISVAVSDEGVNHSLTATASSTGHYTRHFSNDEQFFLKLDEPFVVPSYPIHHDVRLDRPEEGYPGLVRSVVEQVSAEAPDLLSGLRYFFDPADIGRPAFYRRVDTADGSFLYLVRLDLRYRPSVHEVLEAGNNDRGPVYRTRELPLEADLLPLEPETDDETLRVREVFSETWVGETGRGYFVQGIWIDRDLTRFLSAAVTPRGHRLYPYFPVSCKYRSLGISLVEFNTGALEEYASLLTGVCKTLEPKVREIEAALKEQDYDPKMPLLEELRDRMPPELTEPWRRFSTSPYLNDRDMREFALETK
jgi:hypothetical protein